MKKPIRHLLAAIGAATLLASPSAAFASESNGIGPWANEPMIERDLAVEQLVDPELPEFTIIRPEKVSKSAAMPVLLWENGACAWDSTPSDVFLERIAASGVVVLAKGTEDETGPNPGPLPGTQEYLDYVEAMKAMQLEALDWILAENARPGSEFFKRLNPSRVVAMGWSCGGYLGLENAAVDHRISSVLLFNSGPRPRWTDEQVEDLFAQFEPGTPIGMFDGGPTDIAYPGATRGWGLIPDDMPAIFANWAGTGHTGFWREYADLQPQLGEFAVQWIDYTVVSGSAAAREAILGDSCLLCGVDEFSHEQQNWDAFVEPTYAPPRRG